MQRRFKKIGKFCDMFEKIFINILHTKSVKNNNLNANIYEINMSMAQGAILNDL